MILTFKHKGLEAFYRTGSKRGIQPSHAAKLRRILTVLDAITCIEDFAPYPFFRLHQLQGDLLGYWSITVNANWRVIFQIEGENVQLVDYLDYH